MGLLKSTCFGTTRRIRDLFTIFLIIGISITAWMILPRPVWADALETMVGAESVFLYDINIDGADAGDMKIIRSRALLENQSVRQIDISVNIHLSRPRGAYRLSSANMIWLAAKDLLKFDHRVDENGEHWLIRGEKRNKGLWCTVAEVDSRTSISDRHEIPKEALKIVRNMEISTEAYDVTSDDLPVFLLNPEFEAIGTGVRVLDTVELKITALRFEQLSREEIKAAGKVFSCEQFRATSPDVSITHWVAGRGDAAFTVRETRKDADGKLEILLREVAHGNPITVD